MVLEWVHQNFMHREENAPLSWGSHQTSAGFSQNKLTNFLFIQKSNLEKACVALSRRLQNKVALL